MLVVMFTLAMLALVSLSSRAGRVIAHSEDEFVYVAGRVKHPDRYAYEDGTTVGGLIDRAGGFEANEGRHRWVLYRTVDDKQVAVFDPSLATLMAPGESVIVAR
jgi:protein involved in polysaccharide export with SLBB domain